MDSNRYTVLSGGSVESHCKLYLNADKSRIVEEAEGHYLLASPGQIIDAQTAVKYGLVILKAEKPPENKAILSAPENKSVRAKK